MRFKYTLPVLLVLFSSTTLVYAQFPCFGGMEITTSVAGDTIDLCVDVQTSQIRFSPNIGALPFGYIVVDANDEIVYYGLSGNIDFGILPGGNLRVYGFNFTGILPNPGPIGENFNDAILAFGCFELTSNFITIIGDGLTGGMVSTDTGETEVFTCPGDSIPDIVSFTNTGASAGASFTYLITDENNVILDIPMGNSVDFDSAGLGVCRVWGLAYTGALTAQVGDDIDTTNLAETCFGLSTNYVTVIRSEAEGGTVSTEAGETELTVCVGDGEADVVYFDSTGASNTLYAYVLTDTNNVILSLLSGDFIDFDSMGVGVCRVWGLAYTGNVTAMAGDTASMVTLTDGCFDLSDNYVTISRASPDGGMVMTDDGETEVYTCPGDSIPDLVRFDSLNTSGGSYTYVVTDTNNVILSLPAADSVDFDGAGVGICRVWGLAYTGSITAMVGDTASAVDLSDGCFDLSDNYITIYRENPNGGMVMTEDSLTVVYTCPGDGMPDIVRFDSINTSGSFYAYVVTDTQNVILALPGTDFFDFDAAGTGSCRVWGMAYTGNIVATIGDTASLAILSDACYDLSDNYITIYREVPNGGLVMTASGASEAFVCPGDGLADLITFASDSVSNTAFVYVITDSNYVIVDLPSGNTADFEDLGAGVFWVWGLAYTGNLTAMLGDTASIINLSDDCFDLSDNFITVYSENPEAGTVEIEGGGTDAFVCAGDGIPDVIHFDSIGVSNSQYTYVVTDTNNVILSLPGADSVDFEGADEGICRVWGLAYTGNVVAMIGDTASLVALSDACFDLSDNYISVVREGINGGMVMTEDSTTIVYICPSNGIADTVRFDSTGVGNDLFTYVITDTFNVILSLPTGDFADFEDGGVGVCRVWGLAYTDSLTAMVGDTASLVALSNGCFDLSDNYITVYREIPEGGTLATIEGDSATTVCVNAGFANTVEVVVSGASNSQYAYVVTDTMNIILSISDQPLVSFEDSGSGECRLWGLAYTGNILAMPGDTASLVAFSDDCFDLSDNFITVNRIQTESGMVSTVDGQTEVYVCPGDGNPDVVFFDNTNYIGEFFAFVITDTNNVIVGFTEINFANFDGVGEGINQVWGLAYTGNLTAMLGDTLATTILTDGCYDLSENFVTINRAIPDAGMVTTQSGDLSVTVTVGDDIADLVQFDSTGVSNSLFAYVITDENNSLLTFFGGDVFDFEPSAPGINQVWGLAYTGNITIMPGDNVLNTPFTDDCYAISDTFVTVTLEPFMQQIPGSQQVVLENRSEAWPNPVSDQLSVQVVGVENAVVQLRIIDCRGNIMVQRRIPGDEVTLTQDIPVRHLLPGIYTLLIEQGGSSEYLRFVKE
ncbi:MAG TPA: T9SS type A sorting domain-containing protein [Saprospiraceae bacterium]|nr:T9SS type A sorting domain-containing protein [Saprospiraceae bacterium]HMQ81351.1 T9SS type A sorting domain-containing protein [Saprospiraceae bacterium]